MPDNARVGRIDRDFVNGQLLSKDIHRLIHREYPSAFEELRFNRDGNVQRKHHFRCTGFLNLRFIERIPFGVLPVLQITYFYFELHLCLDHAFFRGVESPSIQGFLHFVKAQMAPYCVKKSLFALISLDSFLTKAYTDR